MVLTCGCVGECCGICSLAAAAGRPRLNRENASGGGGGGGRHAAPWLVEEAALEGVDEIYAFHNWPGFPHGSARVSAGPVMASVHDLVIELRGVGGHASQPQVTRDPVVAGAALVTALQSVVSRNISATDAAVLSVCTFRAGEANNVIPARARLPGTLRTFDTRVAAMCGCLIPSKACLATTLQLQASGFLCRT